MRATNAQMMREQKLRKKQRVCQHTINVAYTLSKTIRILSKTQVMTDFTKNITTKFYQFLLNPLS